MIEDKINTGDEPGGSASSDGSADNALDLALATVDAIEDALRADLGNEYLLHLLDDAEQHLLELLERRIAGSASS